MPIKRSPRATRRQLAVAVALAALGSGGAATAASATLVGQWRFDEAAGQVVIDDSPFRLNGQLGSTAGADSTDPVRIAGLSGGALRFDGASFVQLPSSPALAPETLTAAAVVRAPASPGAFRYLMSRGASGCIAGAYGLYTADQGGLAIYVSDGTRYVVSATARPADVWDGGWHRVAGTFDGAALRLYVDGRPVGTPMPAPLRIDYAGTASTAQIARYPGACDLAYSGDVDLVQVWSSALSPEEVAAASPGAPATPLPAAAPGRIILATLATGPRLPASGRAPTRCTVRVAHKRVPAGKRVVVRARVTRLGKVHRRARVVARRAGRRKALSSARIGKLGTARLVLRLRRTEKVEIGVTGRPGCVPAYVRVTR